MAKKYLLYIHDGRFDKEPQKSNLVNLLLARHYGYFQPGTLVEELPAEDQELHKDAVVGNADLREKLEEIKSDWKPCKHGADPKLCKFSKSGKPCK